MRQLTSMDSRFLAVETARSPQHTCSVLIYDRKAADGTRISFDDVRRRIDECLPFVPVLREKLVTVPFGLDEPYWVRDLDFDLEYHVRETALPEPGGWTELCTQVSALHSRPLDRARPLWELTVVDGLTDVDWLPGDAFAIVLKLHFAAVDHVAGVQLITELHDLAPDAPRPVAKEDWAAERPPSPATLLRRAAVHTVMRPGDAARLLGRSLEPILQEVPRGRGRAVEAGSDAPRTRFNYPINPHKVYDATSLPLDKLRAVRAAVPGATVTDVALTVIGGGLRHYLDAKDDLARDALTAALPISTGTPADFDGGHAVTMLVASMHTELADPVARLAAVHATTAASHAGQLGMAATQLSVVSQLAPGVLLGIGARVGAAFANDDAAFANTLVTNTPGPSEPLYLLGARLRMLGGATPLADGAGLGHGLTSYVDRLGVHVTSCREMLPDPQFYLDCIQRSFEELVAAAVPGAGS